MQINLNSAAARKRQFKYLLDRYIKDVAEANDPDGSLTSKTTGLMLAKSQKINRDMLVNFVYACIDDSVQED